MASARGHTGVEGGLEGGETVVAHHVQERRLPRVVQAEEE